MDRQKTEKILASLGLSKLENDCYLSLLEKSPQRASQLSKSLEVPKATVLDALDRLTDEFGIVKRSRKKNFYLFLVDDPSDLVSWFDRKQSEFEHSKKQVVKMLPELRSLQSYEVSKPKVFYFEGKEGMRQALLQVLDEADEIIGYGSNEDDLKYLPNIYPAYYEQRVQKKIHVKAIIPATQFNIEETKMNERKHLRATHLIPEEWKYPIQVNIYKNTSVFYSCEENFTLMIKSKPIAECLKKIFELAYDKAGEFDRELRSS